MDGFVWQKRGGCGHSILHLPAASQEDYWVSLLFPGLSLPRARPSKHPCVAAEGPPAAPRAEGRAAFLSSPSR